MTDVDFLLNRAGLTWQQVDRLAGFKLSRTLPLGVEGLDEAKRQRLRYLVDQLTTAFAERGAVTLDAPRRTSDFSFRGSQSVTTNISPARAMYS